MFFWALKGAAAAPEVVKRWSFNENVVCLKVSAEFGPLSAPSSAGIGPIASQTPAETIAYTTFAPKVRLHTTPGAAAAKPQGAPCKIQALTTARGGKLYKFEPSL